MGRFSVFLRKMPLYRVAFNSSRATGKFIFLKIFGRSSRFTYFPVVVKPVWRYNSSFLSKNQ
jgi:hypothetical protein